MELWSPEHVKTLIPSVIIMALISLFLRRLLIDKPLKTRMIPFQVLTVVLLLIEVGKQVLSLKGGYDLYHLPFHFCSLFIFVLPVASFYNGKHRDKVWNVCSAICASVFLLMMIYPALIYSSGNIKEYFSNFFSFHTVTFHNIVIFEFFLIIALKLHKTEFKKGLVPVIIFMTVFSVVAAVMSQILKTNYANMYTCNIPPLESLRLSVQNAVGYVPAQIMYVSIVSVLQIAFTVMALWLTSLIKKKNKQ